MIRHVVMWKFEAQDVDGKSAAFTAIAEALGALPPIIPEIMHFAIGQDLGTTDGNWDAALITDHKSTADLQTYLTHPEHVAAVAVIKANVTARTAVDFEL